jgi:hypothetical protein
LSQSGLYLFEGLCKEPHCIFPTIGKPTQGWFNLFQIAEALKFKYNFNVHLTRPDSFIRVVDRKQYSFFAEIGLIQLLIYAHPGLEETVKVYAAWQLYDNSPMVNGLFDGETVQFQYEGNSFHTIELNPRSTKTIGYLVY